MTEWRGTSAFVFAPTGHGSADYLQIALGREIEWRAAPSSIRTITRILVSRGFWSCTHTEYSHVLGILPICDEFCESADFAGNQEKIGKRLTQSLGYDQFGGRNAGANGSQPGSERSPYQLGRNDGEILEQTLGDHPGLDENMVGADLAFDLLAIAG